MVDATGLLGTRIRNLRKKRRLTQEQLAELATLDVKFLGGIERGKENPTIRTIQKLASALAIPIEQVLTSGHEVKGEKLLRKRIHQLLDQCDEGELRNILKLIQAIRY